MLRLGGASQRFLRRPLLQRGGGRGGGFASPYQDLRPLSSSYSSSPSSSSPSSSPSSVLTPGQRNFLGSVALVFGSALLTYYTFPQSILLNKPHQPPNPPGEEHVVTNWSGTHEARTRTYLQPESVQQLESMVADAHCKRRKIRPVGSGLSPNGIGLSDQGMINLALLDHIVSIDQDAKRVTVQAGARVEQVVQALRPYGLTLQNFASIKEQQIGGFIQVSAHGTGATLPPVDEQVLSMKLVTPAKGTLELSPQKDPDLFYLARCALGALGVVAEVTLQCVPIQRLVEYTFVTNRKGIEKNHKKWLQENKHLRYMWIPYTDVIVVVQCNPLTDGKEPAKFKSKYSEEDRLQPVRALYKDLAFKLRTAETEALKTKEAVLSDSELAELSFTELRDKLLAIDPLNKEHVMRVNRAEAEYWKRSEGYRVGWSDEILGFDCGGQQWVSEVCFPTGTFSKPEWKDLAYMDELLAFIKREGVAAPAPIEQRWTARSKSHLSPASSSVEDKLFSWIGIIMYLPTSEEEQRSSITKGFMEYRKACQTQLWDKYSANEHWAKIEVPDDKESLAWLQNRIRQHFPVEAFLKARKDLDPNKVLSNAIIEKIFKSEIEL